MKPTILLLLFSLPLQAYSQITFEYLSSPRDFSIGTVRKSPVGEYFVQAKGERNTIYTSSDGIQWTQVWIPVAHELNDIQFFNDGTPLLKPERESHITRRDGTWMSINAGGGGYVEASFIKDDTLFVYHKDVFSYSLNQGQNFTAVFTYNEGIVDHSARLWKLDHHFILHHTGGASDYLSVFDMQGHRVIIDTLDLSYNNAFTYNQCGQVLINDAVNYYLLKEDGELVYETGSSAFTIPPINDDADMHSQGGIYFARAQNTIYKTTGCNLEWLAVTSGALVEDSDKMWIDHEGDIYLLNEGNDHYTIVSNGVYEKQFPDINHPDIVSIDEADYEHQAALTSNNLFSKTTDDDVWVELDSLTAPGYQLQYSPRGDLYIVRERDILYSTDNGHSFIPISIPSGFPVYNLFLEVLDDDFLFIGFLGRSFYSLNNGQDWIDANFSTFFFLDRPQISLVENEILIAEIGYEIRMSKINVTTNELTSEVFDQITGSLNGSATIQDDGTIYFKAFLPNGSDTERYYRFRFGEELKFLGLFPQLESSSLLSSGNILYAFAQGEYFQYDGLNFIRHDYSNLPGVNTRQFIISENEYLYVIANETSIYRSAAPLSLKISTKDPGSFIDFSLFPNPVTDELWLTLSDVDVHRIDSYEIIDQFGQVVQQAHYVRNQAINVARLIPGLYNLILKENVMRVGMKKFVKL